MSDQKRPVNGQRAYTGKTIELPRNGQAGSRKSKNEPPQLPKVPRVYTNPPPSQRRDTPPHPAKPKAQQNHSSRQKDRKQPAHTQRAPRKQPAPAQAPAQPVASKPRPGWKVRVRRFVLLVVALAVLLFALAYYQAHQVAGSVVVEDARGNPSLATPLIGGTNILVVGVDERLDHPEEGVRSDTLILVRLDAAGRMVSMLSIPRDTQVDIARIGPTKINAAYREGYDRAAELYGPDTTPQQGGMALAAQTVSNFLQLGNRGLRIDYTAQINFSGFVAIIDALGGITVDVPYHIVDTAYPTEDFGYQVVEFQPGPQRMDGETALIYARTRHADSDFARSARQQQVMRAIIAELKARGWSGRLAVLPSLLESIKGSADQPAPVLTTMPIDRPDILLGLALLAVSLEPDEIQQVQINPDTVPVEEIGSNLIWDNTGIQEQVSRFMRPREQ